MQYVTIARAKGSELFELETCSPRINRKNGCKFPDIFNLKFKLKTLGKSEFAGGGIYSIWYKNVHLYDGIYTGEKKPFSSDVVKQRFQKHIESITMRGHRVGFEPGNYRKVLLLPSSIPAKAIASSQAQNGGGAVKSYPCKVEFAAANWNQFSTIEDNPDVLEDFTFIYARLNPSACSSGITHGELKAYLETIERGLILEKGARFNLKKFMPNRANLKYGPPEKVWDEFRKTTDSSNIGHINKGELANV